MQDAVTPSEARGPQSSEDAQFLEQLKRALGADYRIDRMIGEGGFGRVYAASDVRLGRNVAIKVIRPELAGARAFVDRFRKEGTALAKFRHPGIVPIYDIREQDGLIYYVMPLIEGDTLRDKLDQRGKLSPKETQRILIELCDCLAATHRAGIIHRDIKPENIILEGFFASALLMDFGIAKATTSETTTDSGVAVGTPTYMSPEQASGEPADNRSDIYSVGVLGYQMLTGKPPFTGRTAHQIIAGHMAELPPAIRKINPSVPKGLADAIERCLEKRPDDRFPNAMALSEALQQVTFGIEMEPQAIEPRNYAMPFFAGLALACNVLASLGPTAAVISTQEFWWFTAGFAGLALLTSPLGRSTTEPLSDRIIEYFARRRALKRLSDG